MTNRTNCVGSYAVSGYTRSDGTEVSGYVRSCGAKHDGDSEKHKESKKHTDKHSSSLDEDMEEYKKHVFGEVVNVTEQNFDKMQPVEAYIVVKKLSCDIAMSNLKNSFKENLDNLKQKAMKGIEHFVNDALAYEPQARITKKLSDLSFCHIYYKLALDFENQKYMYVDNSYLKFKDLSQNMKDVLKETCDMEISNNTDVVRPHTDSELYHEIVKSDDFVNIIRDNITKIKNGELKDKKLSIAFNSFDLRHTIGHATLYNLHYKDDVLFGTLFDGYDFEEKLLNLSKDCNSLSWGKSASLVLGKFLNNNAYRQQEEGMLNNYILYMPIILFEEDLRKLKLRF